MQDDYKIIQNGPTPWHRQEVLMKDKTVELPTDLPVGSIAYTADGSYITVWDGENWVEWGGGNE